MDQRKILSHQIVADNAVEIGAEAVRECSCRQRQLIRPHVIGRRVDEIACKRGCVGDPRDICDINAIGGHQPDLRRIGFPVAAEAIAAEREGKRSQACVARRHVGEAIDPRRQQAR